MANSMFDLSGKVALITGGARGLGEAIAGAMLDHGATVAICDIEAESIQETLGRMQQQYGSDRVISEMCDISDRAQAEGCVSRVVEQLGHIDILVNNAGIHRRVDPTDWADEDADVQIQVNMLGSFHMASAVGRIMVDQQSGCIVNMSALGGGIAGLGRSGSVYGMTKGAIVSLTRDLAAEWGKHGIRVNALAPGWIKTPMTIALQNHPERSQKVMERVPLGRWGEAKDVAGAAVFLASDAASYITGMTIPVDGGAANVIAISND